MKVTDEAPATPTVYRYSKVELSTGKVFFVSTVKQKMTWETMVFSDETGLSVWQTNFVVSHISAPEAETNHQLGIYACEGLES